ncbi:hypothetical protein OOU_Y34scaffold01148g1 [Pyricularia oryzae Y34]|uniref:Uncharacterized protein n=1 Tax=Pyricularia oryzae (strain Y34) TaxID=1143189 RepID=A0AA97PFA1_PYRO3|nr:uncharacterized protein PpBr36_11355 [Pyricularia pennisetigena]ELQ32462.1 hypothetical protein OOU_Y34scaffold01148g1 [Pyricularia oryzae Y34]TLS20467.1 hypothetical protein PpBr36_11355 [Pyricularia pennisetigena]
MFCPFNENIPIKFGNGLKPRKKLCVPLYNIFWVLF